MRLGNLELSSNVVLAPIAGYSDVGLRKLVAKMGAGLTYTEMVSAKGLCYDSQKTIDLLHTTPSEKYKVVQIFGSEPYFIRKAIEHESLQKFDLVDINMGCPVGKIVGNNEGSALLNNPQLASQIVKEATLGGKPISIKMRIGYHNTDAVAVDFAKLMQDSGAVAISVHGRTRDQMYMGKANWDAIAQIVRTVDVPVLANGDIKTVQDYKDILEVTGASGAMIARGAIGNPQLFAQITNTPLEMTKKQIIMEHIDTMLQFHTERYVTLEFKKHFAYYCSGEIGAKQLKMQAFGFDKIQQFRDIVEQNF